MFKRHTWIDLRTALTLSGADEDWVHKRVRRNTIAMDPATLPPRICWLDLQRALAQARSYERKRTHAGRTGIHTALPTSSASASPK